MKLRIEPITFVLIWLIGVLALTHSKECPAVDYIPYTQQIEHKYNLQPNLLVAICTKESNWKNVKGAHGEIGVCQVTPASLSHAFGANTEIPKPVLGYGSTGNYVKVLQSLIGVKADGLYGPITDRAVRQYQVSHNLVPDGLVGPLTWGSLTGYTQLLWNPYLNIEYAAKYLAWLRDTLEVDNPAILMAAYNGGPANPVVKYMVSVEQYRQSIQPVAEAYF